jgi:plastocyanin
MNGTVVRLRAARLAPSLFLAMAALASACTPTALGDDRPPASLDPSSPTLVAEGFAFDRTELDVPANRPFVLVFENRDAASHNVSIYADGAHRDRRFEGVLFGGPGIRWYPVPALAPGTYDFLCDLHPSMIGRLVAS